MANVGVADASSSSGTQSVTNKVLLVGPKGVGKLYLIQNLDSQQHETQGEIESIDDISVRRSAVELDTKYYTAQLDVWVAQPQLQLSDCKGVSGVQALIVMFDVSKPDTFDSITHWAKFAEEREPAVLLCLGNECKAAEADELERGHGRGREWALDNGFEYVEVPFKAGKQSRSAGQKLAESFDETFGLDRVREALECNMWHHMHMKPKPSSRVQVAAQDTASTAAGDDSGADDRSSGDLDDTEQKEDAKNADGPNGGQGSGGSKKKKKKKKKSKKKAPAAANAPSADASASGDSQRQDASTVKTSGMPAPPDVDMMLGMVEDEEDPESLATFTRLFQQIQRASVDARTGNMSDEERRNRATATILELAKAWGIDDEEEEEETNEDTERQPSQ